jgi:predicted transcriptional regulator of viral defense system
MHHSDEVLVAPGDQTVATLAERQHGVVSTAQLHAAGLGRGAIHLRVRRGRLLRIHRGVYAVGHRRLTFRGRLWAAVLACGGVDVAVLSHRTAAAVWA